MQHGTPVSKEEDPDRPLSEKGKRDVEKVAEILHACPIMPKEIHHSGKTRARETAEIIASGLGAGTGAKARGGLSPLDEVEEIAQELCRAETDTFIVGHLPHLGRLAASLLGAGEARNPVRFQQGGLLCLERDDAGKWAVIWMVVPEILQTISNNVLPEGQGEG